MTTFYTALEVSALIITILLPLAGPKLKAKTKKPIKVKPLELSNIHVNEYGYLEYVNDDQKGHHYPVN